MSRMNQAERKSASLTLEASDKITGQVEGAMRKLAVITRIVGWVWMLMLVIATLQIDTGANRVIVIAAMVIATIWTLVTVWAARSRAIFGSVWFVASDTVIVLIVGGASWASGATDLFHGGYLIPSLIVAAYGTNLWGVTLVASLIGLEQAAILIAWGKGPVPALSSLGFILWGLVFGWLFATIRRTDAYRRATVSELMSVRDERVRNLERLELGNRLHDSALQTLQVIDVAADDPERVRTLARRQSRELRRLVESYSSDEDSSFKHRLLAGISEVEELFEVQIGSVIRIDRPLDATLSALVNASHEALTNAAKYSAGERIDVYAAIEDGEARVYVRDAGPGFDAAVVSGGHGMEHSIRGRMDSVGGSVRIVSMPGAGTEVLVAVQVDMAST